MSPTLDHVIVVPAGTVTDIGVNVRLLFMSMIVAAEFTCRLPDAV